MAFANGGTWTVVTWNESKSTATFALSLPGRGVAETGAVATDGAIDLQSTAPPRPTTSGTWRIDLPTTTIATYTFAPATL